VRSGGARRRIYADAPVYEGLYFTAFDERGSPLFSVSNVLRSDGRRLYEGGEWARSDALYPLPHY